MFSFDGQPIELPEEQTITAALLRAGLRPKVFCGIGVCFACLVTVNGAPAQRACVTIAKEGDQVRSCTTSS